SVDPAPVALSRVLVGLRLGAGNRPAPHLGIGRAIWALRSGMTQRLWFRRLCAVGYFENTALRVLRWTLSQLLLHAGDGRVSAITDGELHRHLTISLSMRQRQPR